MPTNKYANPGNFLRTISRLESNDGENTNHPELQNGIQAGTSAIGRYGLMPNTIKEIINKSRQNGTMTPDLQDLDRMNPHEMKAHIEANPDLEDQLAQSLALKVLKNQMGDEDKAAYSWNQGDNLKPEDISDEKLNNPSTVGGQYVDKFRRIRDQINQQSKDPDEQVEDETDDESE